MTTRNDRDPAREVMRTAAAATPDCLPLERLGEALDDAERAHVATCARCQAELALRDEFERDAPADDDRLPVQWIAADLRRRRTTAPPAVVPPMRRATWTSPSWLAAAAGIVLVAGLGYVAWDREPALHQPGRTPAIERGEGFAAMSPAGDLTAPPTAFTWAPVDGASSYELTVLEVDRSVLWRESSSVPRVTPPATLAARLVPGKTVLWEVTARNAAGTVIARSSTASFRVKPVPRGDAHGP